MSDQPTLQTVVTDSLARLDFGATSTPLPDKFGKDYRALHDHYIAALAAEVKAAPPITDKASRETSQKLRSRLVSIRTGLDKTRKALFKPLRDLEAEVNAYIGTTADAGLQGRIKELELVLEQQQEAWDAEQERIRQEAARKVQERNEARGRMLIDAGMVFTGACYELLALKVWPSDISNPSDAEFDEWFKGVVLPEAESKREADRIAAIEKLEEERTAELLAEGFDRAPDTGHLELHDTDGMVGRVMIEELGNMPDHVYHGHKVAAQSAMSRRKAAKEAAAKAEHDRMQAEFRRQAEEKRKQDEDRAAIDAERAALKAEKQRARHERLIALGAEYDGRGFYHVGGDICQVNGNLADMNEEDWIMAQEAVPRAAERLKAINAENELKATTAKRRGDALAIIGAECDEAGTWTLGNATTTHHLLREMSADEWSYLEQRFIEERAKVSTVLAVEEREGCGLCDEDGISLENLAAGCDTSDSPFAELLACSLSLLDEANKAFTTHGNDVRYSDALAKVQAHAGDCVRITRELQQEQA